MFSRIALYCASLNMDPKTSILGCFFVILFCRMLMKNRNKSILSKLPGPKPYPIIGNMLDILAAREQEFSNMVGRVKKFGSVFVMWFGSTPTVAISAPEYVEELLHGSKHLSKGFGYKFAEPFLGQGLITAPGGAKWLNNRKLLTPSFHFKILDTFFDIFREKAKILNKKLDEKAETQEVFDVCHYIKHCTLDTLCDAVMGVQLDPNDSGHSKYVEAELRIAELITRRNRRFWFYPDFIYNCTREGRDFKKNLVVAHSFVDKVIYERRKILQEEQKREDNKSTPDELGKKTRLAFLDMLLKAPANDKIKLTDEDIRAEVNTFMFAGHDTSTAAITWALFILGHYKNVQEELYEEQKQVFQDDMERPITQEDLGKMTYLDRVMKECIRCYPSVPFIARTLDEDVKFGDYVVPKGTTAVVQIYALHRNPNVYTDPDKFDPDRFLPENEDKRHNFAFIPFSAGPRNCIGKRFALLEEKFLLSSIIRRYRIQSCEKPEDLKLIAELTLRSLSGIKIILTKRGAE